MRRPRVGSTDAKERFYDVYPGELSSEDPPEHAAFSHRRRPPHKDFGCEPMWKPCPRESPIDAVRRVCSGRRCS